MSFRLNFKKKTTCSADTIQSFISSAGFEYISFDIFDTLLIRPVINPTDILALIALKYNSELGIDFLSMRLPAESEMQNPHATLEDIYRHIQTTFHLSSEVINRLMQEEIKLETQCLQVRQDVKLFYELAVKTNQKIIAISDMYLSRTVLSNILNQKGYQNIQQVFVSNEYKARKQTGDLFDIVKSKLETSNILHIGDHYESDYVIPQKKGITACYYPKITHFLSSQNPDLKHLINTSDSNDIESMCRNIMIGYTLNMHYLQVRHTNRSKGFKQLSDFVALFLAPYLCYIAFSLQKNPLIQTVYKRIQFVSRDGYLPYCVYQRLNNGRYIEGNYLYGSRLAYWTGMFSSISDVLITQHRHVKKNYTFYHFLCAYITDQSVRDAVLKTYSTNELHTLVLTQSRECLVLLQRNQSVLDAYYAQQKKTATAYYNSELKTDGDRVIVFDVGYSGSVSVGIANLSNKVVDKIYLSETPRNAFCDYRDATYTYVIKNGNALGSFSPLHLILEECFSSLEGNCLGFAMQHNKAVPVLEEGHFSDSMTQQHQAMGRQITQYATQLSDMLGPYIDNLVVSDINPLFELTLRVLRKYPNTKGLFSDITFFDPATHSSSPPLSEKIPS